MPAPLSLQQQEDAYLARLGERVRAWRTEHGMSRKSLALASGVSERYLAQLEAGEGNISVLLLRKVARAMRVAVERLVREEDAVEKPIALCGARRDQEAACGPRAPLWARGYCGRYFRQERAPGARRTQTDTRMINFETSPDRYNHWKLSYDGPVATLALDVAEDKGLAPGYKLKLNSYDLGVDIELHDALNRIRFEHPEVKSVVITSGKSRMFCSGANIYMLGTSSHASKVNFCKFTNETSNGHEDSSKQSGLKFVAAINGTCAGGGYELALACDEIMMVDDRSSTVSLPEVPLLGLLPGTGGLTALVDKRKVRRDLADMFCTTAEGVRADRAQEWRLVDHVAKPQAFADEVKKRAEKLALLSDRPGGQGVPLPPLGENRIVRVEIDKEKRVATITVAGPQQVKMEKSADWYPLRLARELDRAILDLRNNHLDVGLWLFKTAGNPEEALKLDSFLTAG